MQISRKLEGVGMGTGSLSKDEGFERCDLLFAASIARAGAEARTNSMRRKREREQQIEDYYRSRPVKIEAEGKGGRMTGNQIARAYQAVVEQRRQQEAAEQAALAEMRRQAAMDARLTHKETLLDWKPPSEKTAYVPSGISAWKERDYAQAGAPTDNKSWQQRAWDGITATVQNTVNTISSAVAGTLSLQTTGSYKLAAPAKDDDPPWWQKIANTAAQVVTKITDLSAQVVRAAQDTASKVAKRVAEAAAKTINKTTDLAMSLANAALDGVYGYHGPANPPKDVTGQLWMPLPGASSSSSPSYILDNYRVDQLHVPIWPSNNECVTAATIQDMNMIQAILADKFGIPELVHMDLPTFASAFDAQPLWLLRPPADTPVVGGMLHPYAAATVMQGHADWLRANFGCGYHVELTSGNTTDDLIENLQNGYPTSIHISQRVALFENGKFNYLALLGGMPHTVTLAGYDAAADEWIILDPADQHEKWHTSDLMDYWGRQFIGYPPRFAMTTLIPDTTCTPPSSSISVPVATPVAMPPTPTGTSPATPTAQPSAAAEVGLSATPAAPAIPTPSTSTGTPIPSQPPAQQAPTATPSQK